MQAESLLKGFNGNVLILSGDVPLLRFETVQKLINEHYNNNYDATLLTTVFKDSSGYGRIVRDENGKFSKIIEDKDASGDEKKIKEINPAIYIINSKVLFVALKKISPDNSQGEYYLTDIFRFIPKDSIGTVVTGDELEVTGVNSTEQLAEMENELKRRNQIEGV
jgi:bifunctional N-acetylglucosamine-1-phosphate-uridyltransferase/glucosamine-1-phosphate-acetyltransferase GlmU-like protein